MMKKNFIYSLCVLLCGTIFMSSCEDMLNVESDRVEYDMSTLTLNDTVYSVLGILSNVQNVIDRQVLLGELRGDLLVVNEENAVVDVQDIARFDFSSDNKYLDVKDYYNIINNCNIYLARVDTTLERNNQKLMLREYVGVKSVRAWTYMQLAMNYGKVPYFTEPILTHSFAEEVMQRPMIGMQELAPKLIDDLLPYADPEVYPMPAFSGLSFKTSLYFMPIRQLLGDLYLWTKNYKEAAKCYYELIDENKYVDYMEFASWLDEDAKGRQVAYNPLINLEESTTTALASFSNSSSNGNVSELGSVFLDIDGTLPSFMVVSSPGLNGLSDRQVYFYHNGKAGNSAITETNPSTDEPGDLRLSCNIMQMRMDNVVYEGLIGKYELGSTSAIRYGSSIQVYLRFAEALAGLAAEGVSNDGSDVENKWIGAKELAMSVLKEGVKENIYNVCKYLRDEQITREVPKVDENGEIVYKTDEAGEILTDEDGNPIPELIEVTETVQIYDTLKFDFADADYDNNIGVHSRGSGQTEYNPYYSLDNDSCIALYLNKQATAIDTPRLDENGEPVLDEDGNPIVDRVIDYGITEQDRVTYLRNLIIDECALEMSYEGYRFTDLIRFAEASDDVDVLAARVAGRAYANKVTYYNPTYQKDDVLYNMLKNKDNWYLPLK